MLCWPQIIILLDISKFMGYYNFEQKKNVFLQFLMQWKILVFNQFQCLHISKGQNQGQCRGEGAVRGAKGLLCLQSA